MVSWRPKHHYHYNLIAIAIIAAGLVLYAVVRIFFSHAATNNADFNSDGAVNLTDLSILASHFGQGGTQSQGDANGDGMVNLTDLSILAAAWGKSLGGVPPQPSGPIKAAFYYPWFPEAWNQQSYNPFTNFTPSAGYYSSTDTATINRQIDTMIYGHLDAAISSWWGQGSKEDSRFQTLMDDTATKPLKWTLYYEMEGQGDPTVSQIQSDLAYIKTNYTSDPHYLRVLNLPVLFVWADPNDACGMATRWKQANADNAFFVVLKVFNGYTSCTDQPNGAWHQYGFNMTTGEDDQGGYSFTIGPGYWKKGCPYGGGLCTQGDTQPFLARDLNRWNQNLIDLKNSPAYFKLFTTFNEWGEGSALESADGTMPNGWSSASGYGAYIDAMHNNL